jgi:hypothetical protein
LVYVQQALSYLSTLPLVALQGFNFKQIASDGTVYASFSSAYR